MLYKKSRGVLRLIYEDEAEVELDGKDIGEVYRAPFGWRWRSRGQTSRYHYTTATEAAEDLERHHRAKSKRRKKA